MRVPEAPLIEAPYDLVRKIRGSINLLGPLLTRTGQARVAMPGGDAIGSRPVDMHLAGLERMGAEIRTEHGYIVAESGGLHGAQIWLDFPSVGATENILTAAVLAKGTTVIDNAAREPEIVDLCNMLVAMGAQIGGIGTSTIEIVGVDALHPTTHRAVADRIVAGTWAFAAVATRGDVHVRGAQAAHLEIALDKLARAGADVEVLADGFRVRMMDRPRSFDVVTLPYPGLPTDLQPPAIALLAVADGTAMITENLFEARFMFCDEIARMGADVRTDGHHAVVRGKDRLSSAPVRATDIRAGIGLVLAGLRRRRGHRGRRDPPHRPRLRAHRGAAAGPRRRRGARPSPTRSAAKRQQLARAVGVGLEDQHVQAAVAPPRHGRADAGVAERGPGAQGGRTGEARPRRRRAGPARSNRRHRRAAGCRGAATA